MRSLVKRRTVPVKQTRETKTKVCEEKLAAIHILSHAGTSC